MINWISSIIDFGHVIRASKPVLLISPIADVIDIKRHKFLSTSLYNMYC